MNRALRVASPTLTILVALGAAVVATAVVSGGASALLVVRASVQVVLVLAVAGVLGGVLAALVDPDPAARGHVLDIAAAAAAVWTVAAATTAFLLYLGESPALDSPAFGPGLVAFVADVEIGRTWVVAAGLAAVLPALLVAVRGRRGVALLGCAVVAVALPVVLQSATAGDALVEERTVVTCGLVQLMALGSWIGVAVLRPTRYLGVAAFAAVLIAVGAAIPVLMRDGAITPVAVAGSCAVVLAGLVAVVAAVARVDLRAVQLVLLGIGVGLAAAASATRPSPDVPARTSPAEILTGAPLPAAPSFTALLGAWQPDGAWLVLAVALLVAYAAAARRSTGWPAARTASWVVGLVLLVWLTSGGPALYRQVLVVPELAQQVAVLLVVPLLLAGGAPLRLLSAVGPAASLPIPAVRPVPAAVAAVVVVALLDGTELLRWSVTGVVGTEAAAAVLLVIGCLLVRAVATAPRRRAVVATAVLLVAETTAAAVVGTSGTLLLADWYGAMGWGTDALAAQRSAAVLLWLLAVVPTAVLLVHVLRSPRAALPQLARPEEVPA